MLGDRNHNVDVKGEVNPHEDDPTVVTDAQLVAAAATDPTAFHVLYERHAGRIYGYYLRRFLGEYSSGPGVG